MSAFDFFFSFYGLILGLSVVSLAMGASRAFKHRRKVPVGWKTPLLAGFAALDIATFWDAAWTNFQHLPFSYGLLVAGLLVAGSISSRPIWSSRSRRTRRGAWTTISGRTGAPCCYCWSWPMC